ncbi:MAG: ACP S-malonyltransferase [Gammaproteobacteria bacterium]
MPFAFVFPGQGSQSVGMLAAHAATDPVVRATFDEASKVLGYDLWQLTQEGPQERLNLTEYAQPALLAAGVAILRLWAKRGGGEPAAVSGHSLGEFTALVAAGALDFSTAIDVVKFRGQVMQEAVPPGAGQMAAVLGLADAEVEAACREAAQGAVVEAVNYNSAGQVVIAGETAAVQRAAEAAKARGAKRVLPLAVSVPSHSSLLKPAAEKLGKRLESVEFQAPRVRYVSAVDGKTYSNPAELRPLLVRQLASPVRWQDAVRGLAAAGVQHIIECGPGKVLTGLNKRVEGVTGIALGSTDDPAALEAALTATKGS